MGASTFKCPSCGAYLEYQPGAKSLVCPYCATTIDEKQMAALAGATAQAPQQTVQHMRGYHCKMCGAEIITEETTAATHCYYCHSPVILSDRLDGEYAPDGVIPFVYDRQKAEEVFSKYLNSHRFIDKKFFSQAQREMFSGVYYPYWLGDIGSEAVFDGEGTRVSSHISGRDQVTTTRYFSVHREASFTFSNLVRKALSKADRLLTDGIHPYQLDQVKDFSSAYLSGFLAEKRDIEQEGPQADMEAEAKQLAQNMIQQPEGYNSLRGKITSYRVRSTRMRYLLLPAWVLTYQAKGKEKPFYYMLNGQTGKVCGKLPVDYGKLALAALALGGAVCALLCAGGAWLW